MKDKDDRMYCPRCGTKTLQYEKGFTNTHCTKCGVFFTLSRWLESPKKGIVSL